MTSQPFHINFPPGTEADLKGRLANTRWADAVTNDWRYGMNRSFLRELVSFWRSSYNFSAAEQRLNALPQFRAEIRGFGLHYTVLKGRGPHPTPLLLMNGWPSSFVEYRKLAPMLADPASFGGSAEDAFDVIMPTLPGFGYSDRPTRPHQVWPEDLFHALMTDHLGYQHYVASGTDIGAGVARRLALHYPDAVRGIHVSAVADLPLAPSAPHPTPEEVAYQARAAAWEAAEGAYEHVHYTTPQNLAFALADSPVGLASWIVEKYHAWSDHGPDLLQTFPMEMLLDILMIYWTTNTIASSMRLYYDSGHFRAAMAATDQVVVPTAICMWPKDLVIAPESWCRRAYNVTQYTLQKRGGHFPAWEAPDSYADDLRRFTRSLPGI